MSAQPGHETGDVPTSDSLHRSLREFWDADAEVYDRSASHSASDPVERAAWRGALERHLPPAPARILDAGAGTGTISLLAADLGHDVTALDLSPRMLARARAKAEERGLRLRTVSGPATDPPEGPFDAVVERHLLWTLPDPVGALRSWRRVAGRIVLYEGIWKPQDAFSRAKAWLNDVATRVMRIPHDHHAHYDDAVTAALPFPEGITPARVLEAVEQAGFTRARIERLRDVEWARLLDEPPLLGALGSVPQFAVLAEA